MHDRIQNDYMPTGALNVLHSNSIYKTEMRLGIVQLISIVTWQSVLWHNLLAERGHPTAVSIKNLNPQNFETCDKTDSCKIRFCSVFMVSEHGREIRGPLPKRIKHSWWLSRNAENHWSSANIGSKDGDTLHYTHPWFLEKPSFVPENAILPLLPGGGDVSMTCLDCILHVNFFSFSRSEQYCGVWMLNP